MPGTIPFSAGSNSLPDVFAAEAELPSKTDVVHQLSVQWIIEQVSSVYLKGIRRSERGHNGPCSPH